MIKKKEFLRGLRILDTNLTQLQATKDQGEQQLRELKNIDKSRMLEAISEIGRKMMKQIKYYSTLRKQMQNLTLQNFFVQKLMKLNTTLILLRFH